jgi:hypothetical protein
MHRHKSQIQDRAADYCITHVREGYLDMLEKTTLPLIDSPLNIEPQFPFSPY